MRRTLTGLVLSLLLLSCGGDGGGTAPTVTSVSLSSTAETLTAIGATVQLSGTVRDEDGGTISGMQISWSSSSAAVATVTNTGLVTAVGNGSATISAVASGVAGTATITVQQAAANVVLSPESNNIETGETLQLEADVQDSGGTALATPSLSWGSADETLATVDQQGLVSALGKGEVVITASQDGASGNADFTIVLADLMPDQDIVLSGTVAVAEVMIPEGVTVTVAGGLTLVAEGVVTIAGSIMGACESLDLESMVSVWVTGAIDLACAEMPEDEADIPTFRVAAPGWLFDGAEVQISGDGILEITEPPAGASEGALRAQGDSTLFGDLRNSIHIMSPERAKNGDEGQPGANGSGWSLVSPGTGAIGALSGYRFLNSTVRAQHGGHGGPQSVTGNFQGSFRNRWTRRQRWEHLGEY